MLKLKDIIVTQTSSTNASLTPKVRGEAARYLDSFVSMLDDKVTENAKLGSEEGGLKPILEGAGGLGIGMSGVGTDEVGGEGEKGGAGMVRSLSKLSEIFVEVGAKDFDEYGEATKTVSFHLSRSFFSREGTIADFVFFLFSLSLLTTSRRTTLSSFILIESSRSKYFTERTLEGRSAV